jgi:diguanylate cyclase (GGDEF)-like protein/PAS domain S-box-containing protein
MHYSRWVGPDRPFSNGSAVARSRLQPDVDAPAAARTALEPLHGEIDDDVFERAELLTSETVANAVKYGGGGEVRLDVWRTDDSVSVVVSDDGPGFLAVARDGAIAEMDGGFGLPLIDTLATAWGNGKGVDAWVWFEVAPIIASGPPVERASRGDELLDIRMAVESLKSHALVALDNTGRITNWGAGPEALTGFPTAQMLGRHVSQLFLPASKTAFARDRETAEAEGWFRAERWVRRSGRTELWAGVELAPIRDRSSRQLGLSLLISDLTAHKRELDTREHLILGLREQALTDEVTGLPNRRHWMQVLRREMARSRRQSLPLAVVMLDLNGFKEYNDSHGHPAGDSLLRAVARQWAEAIRSSDLLARYGGDEFSVTLPDCPPDLAREVVERIESATPAGIGAAAGIEHAQGADTADTIVKRADEALYDAKRRGVSISTADSPAEDAV